MKELVEKIIKNYKEKEILKGRIACLQGKRCTSKNQYFIHGYSVQFNIDSSYDFRTKLGGLYENK